MLHRLTGWALTICAFTFLFTSIAIAQPTTDAELLRIAAEPTNAVAAVAATAPNDWTAIADQIFNALALALVALVVKIVSPVALKAGDWLGQRSAVEEILADNRMMETSEKLGRVGLDLALGRLGYTREDLKDVRIRNAAFSFAATFVKDQWPEVWTWVDKNHNGQIDWLESLTARDLPPVDHNIAAKAPAEAKP
jgi:hypothetical protein